MRKLSFALAVGFLLCACGGEEKAPPATPATPPPSATPPAPTAEAPKEEAKPKETLGQLEEKTGRAYVEAMNAHDAKKLASLYSEGAVVKIAGAPADASGREAIAQSYGQLFGAFPDFKSATSRVWAKGDTVVVEWAFNGTHSGDLWGIKGTEKKVGCMGVDVMWFTPEGQIKEQHTYYDGATILSQIGVSPMKARAIPALPAKPEVFMTAGADESKNEGQIKAMTAALEAKKEADFLGSIADTVEYDDMTQPTTMKGKADAKKFFKEMTTGFPDAKQTINHSIAIGDFVISEGTMSGTHKGSFFGLAATKKSVNLRELEIMQLKDGKMVKGWAYANGADLMMQLGKMPAPGAAKPGAAKPGDAKAAPASDKKPADPKAAPKK